MVVEEFESWLKYGVIMTLVKRKKCPGGRNTQNTTTDYNIKLKRNENARVFARPVLVLCSQHVGRHQLLSSYLALTLELQLEILRENYKIKIHDYSIPQREGRVASRQHADSKTSVTFPLTGLLKEITKHKHCSWS
jgi:hypothetical protein